MRRTPALSSLPPLPSPSAAPSPRPPRRPSTRALLRRRARARPQGAGAVLDVQRVAQPQRRGPAGQPTCRRPTTSRPATSPRPSSGSTPTSCSSTSSTTRPRRSTCSATTTSRSGRTARTRSSSPTRSSHRPTPASRAASTSTTTAWSSGGDDAFGFGLFPGQYGMVVYSKYPILADQARTFQHFLWKDMPGALLPDDPATAAPADWYSPEEQAVFRLSSKSPLGPADQDRQAQAVHFLVSHPTPPTFDGAEDRNGTRNHDEIRFWADYVGGRRRSSYIYDDEGRYGGLKPGTPFVIAGDQNADPLRRRLGRRRDPAAARPPADRRDRPDVAPAVPRRARSRAERTRRTRATRRTTPPTSPTPRRATCASTTCCRHAGCGPSGRASSGRPRPTRSTG